MKSIATAHPLVSHRHPDDADNSLLLSAYVYEIGDQGFRERSRRTVQEDLIRSAGKGVSRRLVTLCEAGWLTSTKPNLMGKASTYRYGHLLSSRRLRDEWRIMAERIWGTDGFLSGWMGDPLFAHRALGWSQTLMYAVLLQHPGPFTLPEIERFFDGLFSPSQTKYRVGRLVKKGILVEEPSGYRLSAQHADEAEKQRARFSSQRERIRYSIQQERKHYRAAMGRSEILEQLRTAYRGLTCVRCPNEARQIEHFPPVKWFGEDDWFLTFPICEQCNGETSLFIRNNRAPRPLTIRKVSLVGGNPLRSLEERIASYRDTFYSSVESGQAERAMKAVAKARATFEALTGESGALIFRLPSGVDFHLDPKRHGLLLDPTVLSTEKPTFDPNLTRVLIRKKGPNPMRKRGKDFNDSDKSK